MFACDLGHAFTPRHSGQFVDSEIALHPLDAGPCASTPGLFSDHEMTVREGRNLWQMRDAEYLVLGRQLREHSTHTFRDRATNARVDLVEDDHHVSIRAAQGILDGQKEP